MLQTLFMTLSLAAPPADWPALTQKPYADKPVADIGLRPLLLHDGKKVATKEEWQPARQKLEQMWLDMLGKAPARPDQLDVKIEKTEADADFSRTLLSFTGEGDDRIRAWLLVPAGLTKGEKRPAIVVLHQTTRDTLDEPVGKGKRPDLALALQLTLRGYITLSPECYILKDKEGWAKGQAEALAKRRPGWTGMGKMTFDASRCIDYLETLREVDKQRIGCIGFSLGAKEVLYAMAFEPRFQVGVFNEGGIGLKMSNWTDPWYFGDKMKPKIGEFEHHQVLALIAPRPFLILGGDSADGDASWPFVHAVMPVYDLFGARDRIGLINHKEKHSYPKEARRLSYQWVDHWLKFEPKRDEAGE